MSSLFTPSKKRPRYSMPAQQRLPDTANNHSAHPALSQTLPRNHTAGYHASAFSTPLPFPAFPPSASSPTASPLPLLPSPSPSSASPSSALSLTQPTPTALAVTSLLTQRAERHLSSTLLSHSHALSLQHEEALSTLRLQHQQERLAWRAEQLEAERRLRGELAETRHQLEERERGEEERRGREEEERRERDKREREQRERVDELQVKLTFLASMEQRRRAEADVDDDRRREERRQMEEQREVERKDRAELTLELASLREKEKGWKEKGGEDKKRLEGEVDVYKRKLRDRDDDLHRLQQRIAVMEAEARERALEEKRREEEERKRTEREAELGSLQESFKARLEEAAETDRRYRQVVEELREARTHQANTALLSEQCRGWEAKVRRLEADIDKAQQSLIDLDRERGRERDLIHQLSQLLQCTDTLDAVLASARSLHSALAAASQEVAGSQERGKAAELAMKGKEEELRAAMTKADFLEDELGRVRQRVQLLSMEVEGLKRLLASYDEEDGRGGHDASQKLRLADVESRLDAAQREKQRMQEEVRVVRSDNAKVKAEREMLEVELQRVKEQAGGGGDNLVGVKVLHMVNNPHSNAQIQRRDETIARLQDELERLRERLHLAEVAQQAGMGEHNVAVPPFTPSVSLSPISHVVTPFTSSSSALPPLSSSTPAELSQRLHQLESSLQAANATLAEQRAADAKRYDRLKSVFAERVQQFREGCFRLTGYKVEVLSGQWRLKPIYAEQETDVLLFSREEATGKFSLMETELVKKMGDEVLAVLTRWQSIPAFLATVIMELCSRQTRV